MSRTNKVRCSGVAKYDCEVTSCPHYYNHVERRDTMVGMKDSIEHEGRCTKRGRCESAGFNDDVPWVMVCCKEVD